MTLHICKFVHSRGNSWNFSFRGYAFAFGGCCHIASTGGGLSILRSKAGESCFLNIPNSALCVFDNIGSEKWYSFFSLCSCNLHLLGMELSISLYVQEPSVFLFLGTLCPFFFWLDFDVLSFGVLPTMYKGLKAWCGRNIAYKMGLVSSGLGERRGEQIRKSPLKSIWCVHRLLVYKPI